MITIKTLIKNATIVTMDNGKVIPSGYIAISDGVISAIGSGEYSDIGEKIASPDEIIDASGKIAMPGMINAHTHSAMTLFRGYAGGHPLDRWLQDYIFPIEDKLQHDDFLWGNMLAAAEMIQSGTTCCMDMYFGMDAMVQAISQSGMRANLGRCVQWFGGDDASDFSGDVRIKEAIQLYADCHNAENGRIKVDIAPHSVYLTSAAYLQRTYELACEHDLRFHIHVSETLKENAECAAKYEKTPVQYLDSIGVLSDRVTAAHCVHLNGDDMRIMAERGVSVTHNPASNLKLASGIAKTWDMRSRGINIALGTDGVSSNNNLDMIREMYLAATVPCGVTQDALAMDAYGALTMATVNGAKALGRADIGALKAGMQADIVLINADAPHMMPMHSPCDNIVYAANGGDVCMTMVAGKVLYKNGEFLTLDIERIRYGMGESVGRLFA